MTQYHSSYDGTTPFSDVSMTFACLADTELTYTVPGTINQTYKAVFSFPISDDVYVALNRTPVFAVAGITEPDARTELRPTAKFVRGGDVIHLLSRATSEGSITLYQLPT